MELWTLLLPAILIAWTHRSEALVEARYSTTNDLLHISKCPTGNCRCRIMHHDTMADCRYCGLDRVPDCVPNSTRHLIMKGNNLGVLRSKSLQRFSELEMLDISHCNISRLEEHAFEGLQKLRFLKMSNNELPLSPDTYSVDVFRPLTRLKELYLGNNTRHDVHASTLDYPDQALATLTSLEHLGMDGLRNRSFGPGFSRMSSLRVLDVSGVNGTCGIESLLNHTFVHLRGLTHLSMKNCCISHTENGTFSPLTDIQYLDLSRNYNLTLEGFANSSHGLKGSKLKVLRLNHIDSRCIACKTLCTAHLCNLVRLPLEELHLNGNKLRYVESSVFIYIPRSIKRLYVRNNYFFVESDLLTLTLIPNISVIDAGRKDPRTSSLAPDIDDTFIGDCDDTKACPPFDQASCTRNELFALENEDDSNITRRGFVERLNLSWQRSLTNVDRIVYNAPRLKYLDMTGLMLPNWIGPVSGLENLTVLNMSCNFAHYIDKNFFYSVENIEVLNISWNFFPDLFNVSVAQNPLLPLKKLRVVDLSYIELTRLPGETAKLFIFVEELYLAGNKLNPEWLELDFSLLKRLRILDLSLNSLTTISNHTRTELDTLAKDHKVELRFQFNPIQCSCDNLLFMTWLYETEVYLPGQDDYRCMLEDGSIRRFNFSEEILASFTENCQSKFGLAMGSLGAVVLCVAMALFAVIYRYRWHLRYLYHATRKHLTQPEELQAPSSFQFDAFVSYASEDESFVRDELMPRLERQEGLRLCVHSRDFTPGRPIISNAVEAVQRSRRTLCLVSRSFLDSYWCRYEMQMAKMESLHAGRDVVVMVLYEHIRACSLPKEVLFYIRSESYVEYPRDSRCVQFFWDNLVRALK